MIVKLWRDLDHRPQILRGTPQGINRRRVRRSGQEITVMTEGVLDVIGVQAENVKERVIRNLQVVVDQDPDPDHEDQGPDLGPDHGLDPKAPDVQSITARMIVTGVNQNLVHLLLIP